MTFAFLCVAFVASISADGAGVPEVTIAPGVSMPMLAFGTMRSTLDCSLHDAVVMWLKLGGRHIDMSKVYGTEKEVGEALKDSGVPRSELFLTAKIEGPIGYEETLEQMAKFDLPDVGVDYLDLLLIHVPCQKMSDFPNKCGSRGSKERLDTWRGLEHLKATGKVRAIGVSNYLTVHLQELYEAGYQPSVNQVQWHLGNHDDELLHVAMAHGTHLEAWASLAGPHPRYPVATPGIGLGDPRLKAIAAKYHASTAQVALQWNAKMGVTPVTGTCSESHAKGDLEAFGFDLSNADIAYLDSLTVDESEGLAGSPESFGHPNPHVPAAAGLVLLALVAMLALKWTSMSRATRGETRTSNEYSVL